MSVAHRIVWCTVATVDRRGRPRSRVLHPYWERSGDALVGWITTRPTPLKVAHLAHSPYLSCSYWDATQDAAVAECAAEWVEDVDRAPTPGSCSARRPSRSATIPYSIWPDGPEAPDAGVLRLTPVAAAGRRHGHAARPRAGAGVAA